MTKNNARQRLPVTSAWTHPHHELLTCLTTCSVCRVYVRTVKSRLSRRRRRREIDPNVSLVPLVTPLRFEGGVWRGRGARHCDEAGMNGPGVQGTIWWRHAERVHPSSCAHKRLELCEKLQASPKKYWKILKNTTGGTKPGAICHHGILEISRIIISSNITSYYIYIN